MDSSPPDKGHFAHRPAQEDLEQKIYWGNNLDNSDEPSWLKEDKNFYTELKIEFDFKVEDYSLTICKKQQRKKEIENEIKKLKNELESLTKK